VKLLEARDEVIPEELWRLVENRAAFEEVCFWAEFKMHAWIVLPKKLHE
jgi:hypothetical protein